ncbi:MULTISPECIES: ATP-grasp ribosomal peptide maturase [unclassified Streptomyces]|uniref:ATP-grasp ribosomal peptide maturase n=1 Tax=unclassified Streptomyces TaxID=2593676 RepID=UPI000DBA925E|nr:MULTISPECIES: ATP-grasp ribosomal peptide maturase [unclassified Streptomyces]MYT74453.1 ATP-grasp ribosomal peptide maturase [Streptomyces sp. SID8367]RAJ91431.1 ATP-grasp ribosomal peptide maturase [Streptomyces sp. PsTaAH-137]
MTVLILTCEQDVTADLAVVELNANGIPVLRLDPAELPGGVDVSGEYVHGAFEGHLSVGGRVVSMQGLRSIWVRRPGTPATRSAEASSWLSEESAQALYGMLRCTGARWMNHPDAARQARLKPWQLWLARECGLPVPPTLITTFPRVAREFAVRYPDLVVKPVSGSHPGDDGLAVPTTRVRPDEDFRAVEHGPTLLQRRIRKAADIRLTVVGERMFAARAATGPDTDDAVVDVRFSPSDVTWSPVPVPPSVAEAVSGYLLRAQLAYGAFDFAEDADGIWWFLECNQSGQFGFIEIETGQRIGSAVAQWLAGEPLGAASGATDPTRP